MTTQEYKWMYDFALVTKQQLEEIGFKIDLQVMDWSTLGQRRLQPKEYDVFTTGMGSFYDPTHHIYLSPNWPGWTSDEEIVTLNAQLARETDQKKRYDLWVQMTKTFYDKVPVIRYGDLFGLRAIRKHVKEFNRQDGAPTVLGSLAGEVAPSSAPRAAPGASSGALMARRADPARSACPSRGTRPRQPSGVAAPGRPGRSAGTASRGRRGSGRRGDACRGPLPA